MRQEEAKREIIELWMKKPKEERTESNAAIFALFILKEHIAGTPCCVMSKGCMNRN